MRRAISAAARRFHESQGLLTASALGALQRLEEGAALIRFAHQPNFLPDANLFAQVLYLDRLSDVLRNAGTPAAAVVFFVDHDVAGNERLHVSEVWDPSAPGHIRRFRLPLGPNDERRAILALGAPGATYRQVLLDEIKTFATTVARQAKRQRMAHMEAASSEISRALGLDRQFGSLAAFTSYPLMYVSLEEWELGVLFCPLSALSSSLGASYETILEALERTEGLSTEDSCWYVCECGLRRTITSSTTPLAACPACARTTVTVGELRNSNWQDTHGRIVPRVVIDDLADYLGLGVAGGTSYFGGRDHLRRSQEAGRRCGFPIGVEASWRVSLLIDGPMERAAASLYVDVRSATPSLARAVTLLAEGRQGLAYYLSAPHLRARLPDVLRTLFDAPTMSDDTPVTILEQPNASFQRLQAFLAARHAPVMGRVHSV